MKQSGSNPSVRRFRFEIFGNADGYLKVHTRIHQVFGHRSERSRARLWVVLRELLTNAVEHGHRGHPDRMVVCEIFELSPTSLRIEVEDQGEGFAHESLSLHLPDYPQTECRGGLRLINALCDDLAFNERGNKVTACWNWSESEECQRTQ